MVELTTSRRWLQSATFCSLPSNNGRPWAHHWSRRDPAPWNQQGWKYFHGSFQQLHTQSFNCRWPPPDNKFFKNFTRQDKRDTVLLTLSLRTSKKCLRSWKQGCMQKNANSKIARIFYNLWNLRPLFWIRYKSAERTTSISFYCNGRKEAFSSSTSNPSWIPNAASCRSNFQYDGCHTVGLMTATSLHKAIEWNSNKRPESWRSRWVHVHRTPPFHRLPTATCLAFALLDPCLLLLAYKTLQCFSYFLSRAVETWVESQTLQSSTHVHSNQGHAHYWTWFPKKKTPSSIHCSTCLVLGCLI